MKTRNFFLGIFGVALIGIIYFAISEYFSYLPRYKASSNAESGVNITSGYIQSNKQLEESLSATIIKNCENPWILLVEIPILDHTIDELNQIGISNCYDISGRSSLQSHLINQGVLIPDQDVSIPIDYRLQGKNIKLYFDYDADFNKLGTDEPETVSLSGYVVHDLNANGIHDSDEFTIPGSQICIERGTLIPICTSSSSSGRYQFDSILPGEWIFYLHSPGSDRLNTYRYSIQLIEENHLLPEQRENDQIIPERTINLTSFSPLSEGIPIKVDKDKTQNFYLTQGWATYVTAKENENLFDIKAYHDMDVTPGITRIYNGNSGPTYDQHDGLDISCPAGTEILSIAEGYAMVLDDQSTVAILHQNQLLSIYGHGTPLVENYQFVPRGYPITLCDSKYTDSQPHLHLAIWKNTSWLNRIIYSIPAFADLYSTDEKWVFNHSPLDRDYFAYVLIGGQGIWTELNQPHFPDVKYTIK